MLLSAIGIGFSPRLALIILCMSGAASLVPIAAGGAVAGMGANAGVLLVLGVPHRDAINFSLASSLLLTTTALAAAALGLAWLLLLAPVTRRAREVATLRPA